MLHGGSAKGTYDANDNSLNFTLNGSAYSLSGEYSGKFNFDTWEYESNNGFVGAGFIFGKQRSDFGYTVGAAVKGKLGFFFEEDEVFFGFDVEGSFGLHDLGSVFFDVEFKFRLPPQFNDYAGGIERQEIYRGDRDGSLVQGDGYNKDWLSGRAPSVKGREEYSGGGYEAQLAQETGQPGADIPSRLASSIKAGNSPAQFFAGIRSGFELNGPEGSVYDLDRAAAGAIARSTGGITQPGGHYGEYGGIDTSGWSNGVPPSNRDVGSAQSAPASGSSTYFGSDYYGEGFRGIGASYPGGSSNGSTPPAPRSTPGYQGGSDGDNPGNDSGGGRSRGDGGGSSYGNSDAGGRSYGGGRGQTGGNEGATRGGDYGDGTRGGGSSGSSGSGGFGCFVAGTLVLMADGSSKAIEDVHLEDRVMAFDGLGPLVSAEVTDLFVHGKRKVISVDGVLTTPEHPFLLSDGSYQPIGALAVGTQIVRADGSLHTIESISAVDGVHTVYNFTVEGLHTYIAGGFRVHNIKPIILDLDGNGIKVMRLDQSSIFMDTSGEGLEHRTAWAAAGDAVLYFDPDGRNEITEKRQFVFTEWDPTATSDLEALASVFDSNGDGVLNASDADFSKFKLMVTNADGSIVSKTLAELGITELDLTADATHIELSDGSVITGQTTFKRSDGTTGTVGDMLLASEAQGHRVE
ncbi:hypothetical protein IWQ51_006706, partial [Labrenzia sp. EL_142]|nr:hypothetical protein [Labrenzia sp. EL_142]